MKIWFSCFALQLLLYNNIICLKFLEGNFSHAGGFLKEKIDQSFSFPFLRIPFGTATLVNSPLSLSFLEIFHQCKHQGPGTKKPFSAGFC